VGAQRLTEINQLLRLFKQRLPLRPCAVRKVFADRRQLVDNAEKGDRDVVTPPSRSEVPHRAGWTICPHRLFRAGNANGKTSMNSTIHLDNATFTWPEPISIDVRKQFSFWLNPRTSSVMAGHLPHGSRATRL
jgi:hypothetical protein